MADNCCGRRLLALGLILIFVLAPLAGCPDHHHEPWLHGFDGGALPPSHSNRMPVGSTHCVICHLVHLIVSGERSFDPNDLDVANHHNAFIDAFGAGAFDHLSADSTLVVQKTQLNC